VWFFEVCHAIRFDTIRVEITRFVLLFEKFERQKERGDWEFELRRLNKEFEVECEYSILSPDYVSF
jgi:hypothetical protein